MAASVDKMLRAAKTQAKRGAFAEAEAIYREILRSYPANKRAQSALAELARARASSPVPDLQGGLARLVALQQAGRHGDVIRAAKQAQPQFRDEPAVQAIRATSLEALGDHAGAAELYRAYLRAHPDDFDALGKLGNALLRGGDAAAAGKAFARMLELRPGDPIAHNNLGNALANQLQPEAALRHFSAAIEAKPDLLPARVNLGRLLMLRAEVAEARVQFEAAVALAPDNPTLLDLLATTLKSLGEIAQATRLWDQALALAPRAASLHLNRALVETFTPGDPRLAALEALHDDRSLSDVERGQIGFALFKAYDDLGDTARAFPVLRRANALRKSEIGYEISQSRARMAQIASVFAKPMPALEQPAPAAGPEPIFILGLPRSGTTLVEQIISAHPQVRGGDEREELNARLKQLDWSDARAFHSAAPRIARDYREMLARLGAGASFVTDKMPSNFQWIGPIRTLFPKARIVHVHRDPRAVLWSIYRTRFSGTGYGFGYDLQDLVAYHALYRDLMAHWQDLYGGAIYSLDYEALTRDPEPRIRALIAALDLEWDDACLRPQDNKRAVNTASNLQVRRAIYAGSSQDWQRYAAQLAPAFAALP